MANNDFQGRIKRAMDEGPVDLEFGWAGDFADPTRDLRLRVISSSNNGIWIFVERESESGAAVRGLESGGSGRAPTSLKCRTSRWPSPALRRSMTAEISGGAAVKVCMFHLMPYRDLPSDFVQRYDSAFIDPLWFDVANLEKVGEYYNSTLDELLHAAKAGVHGVCTNEHHQNAYGFMANPSLMGAVLAKATNGQDIAIVQLGSTLPSTTPPTRIAEEYAMLDCISGGRLVAGFPTGLPSDAVISNGIVPIEQRERFREALALVLKAWSAREVFAWNGKHYQLGMVNLWPRPIQQPHPPVWIPGSGFSSTVQYVVEHDHCFCHLSYFGAKNAKAVTDRYWDYAASKGRDDNPYRLSFLQLIGVAETDAEAEDSTPSTPSISSTSCCTRRPHYLAIRAASNTARWCRLPKAIRAPR